MPYINPLIVKKKETLALWSAITPAVSYQRPHIKSTRAAVGQWGRSGCGGRGQSLKSTVYCGRDPGAELDIFWSIAIMYLSPLVSGMHRSTLTVIDSQQCLKTAGSDTRGAGSKAEHEAEAEVSSRSLH